MDGINIIRPVLGLLIGVVIALVIIALIIIVFIKLKRKRKTKGKTLLYYLLIIYYLLLIYIIYSKVYVIDFIDNPMTCKRLYGIKLNSTTSIM